MHGHGLNCFKSHLSSRIFRIKCDNNFSSSHTCLCCVPQDSVLNPLLIVLCINPLGTLFISSLNHHLCADATTFLLFLSISNWVSNYSLSRCPETDVFLDFCKSLNC